MSKQPRKGPDPSDLADLIDGRGTPDSVAETGGKDRHFGIRIARDGTWYYMNSPIRRQPLVKLFSTVVKRDDNGDFWMETPVERGRIDVEDAPFVAVEVAATGEGRDAMLTFRTNLDHEVLAGTDHPIRVEIDPATEEPSPYIHVRDNLEALIARSVFYEIAELAEEATRDGEPVMGVWSSGVFFPLGPPE